MTKIDKELEIFTNRLLAIPGFKHQTFQLINHREEEAAEKKAPLLGQEFNDFRWGTWKNFEETGVYILWDKEKSVCYVGKCSQSKGSYLGKRIWSHFGKLREFKKTLDHAGVNQALTEYFQRQFPAYWLTVIAVPPGFSWIATAFEEFLIEQLPSGWNTVGRKKTVVQ